MEKLTMNRRRLMQALAAVMAGTALPLDLFADDQIIQDPGVAIHVPAGGGKKGKIGDGDVVFKLSKSQTGGHLGVSESVLLPGILGAPPHLHRGFDEICRVTEGVLSIMVGEKVFEVKAGDWHLRPKGVVHTFWNSGNEPAKFIDLYVPGGHEEYMEALADLFVDGKRPAPGDLDGLAKRFDIVFDFSRLKTVMDTYKVHL